MEGRLHEFAVICDQLGYKIQQPNSNISDSLPEIICHEQTGAKSTDSNFVPQNKMRLVMWTKEEESLLWGILMCRIAFKGYWLVSCKRAWIEIFWTNIASVFNAAKKILLQDVNQRPPTALYKRVDKLSVFNIDFRCDIDCLHQIFFCNKEWVRHLFKEELYSDVVGCFTEERLIKIMRSDMRVSSVISDNTLREMTRPSKYTLLEELVIIGSMIQIFQLGCFFPSKNRRIPLFKEQKFLYKFFLQWKSYLGAAGVTLNPYYPKERSLRSLYNHWSTLNASGKVPKLFLQWNALGLDKCFTAEQIQGAIKHVQL